MGLGFSPWGGGRSPDADLRIIAQTHAESMASIYRDHLKMLQGKRTQALECAAAFDLLGDSDGHYRAIAHAAEIDTEIERAEANLGEWTAA